MVKETTQLSTLLAAGAIAVLLAACGQPAASAPTPPPATVAPLPPTSAATALPATGAPSPVPASPTAVPTALTMPTALVGATALPVPQPPGSPERISFAPGATSGAVEGAVVRGEERRYLLGAQGGQQMTVRITSLEDNAVFQIYGPNGAALPGAEPGRDARQWTGVLPASGDYQIAVGGTRGNATYRLDVTIVNTPPAGDTTIRGVNWDTAFASDPQLRVEYQGSDRFVSVNSQSTPVGGIPQLDQIVYVDMDGDGVEEAAIPLFSGGTAGNIGALVFRMGARAAVLADWIGGYKLGASVEQGRLVVSNALYEGWEPNCCPSGRSYDTYVLQNGKLALVAQRAEGIGDARPQAVQRFYDLLASKDYPGAYALLSATMKAANPYDAWVAGYANTLAIQASVAPDPSSPEFVRVELSATDTTPDGGQLARRYAGAWRTVWEPARPGWALADPAIAEVP
jgi:hypothetical protein